MPKVINVAGAIIPNSDKWIYDLLKIDSTSPGDIQAALDEANGDDVIVRINSNGGDVFAGSEIYDILSGYQGNLLIRIVGIAASAASIIACAGASEIAPTAMLMIHNVKSRAEGDYHDMANAAEALKEANRSIMAAYRNKTGLSEKELLDMMDKETFISADTAVAKGFVDKISEYKKADGSAPGNGVSLAASMTGLLPVSTIQKFRAERAKLQAQLELLKLM
ncbi:MAG: Clp protease ClpP [Ruminococcus sp.]|nr:Clp protease ClpP [Ruminococcus sp.]